MCWGLPSGNSRQAEVSQPSGPGSNPGAASFFTPGNDRHKVAKLITAHFQPVRTGCFFFRVLPFCVMTDTWREEGPQAVLTLYVDGLRDETRLSRPDPAPEMTSPYPGQTGYVPSPLMTVLTFRESRPARGFSQRPAVAPQRPVQTDLSPLPAVLPRRMSVFREEPQ